MIPPPQRASNGDSWRSNALENIVRLTVIKVPPPLFVVHIIFKSCGDAFLTVVNLKLL